MTAGHVAQTGMHLCIIFVAALHIIQKQCHSNFKPQSSSLEAECYLKSIQLSNFMPSTRLTYTTDYTLQTYDSRFILSISFWTHFDESLIGSMQIFVMFLFRLKLHSPHKFVWLHIRNNRCKMSIQFLIWFFH